MKVSVTFESYIPEYTPCNIFPVSLDRCCSDSVISLDVYDLSQAAGRQRDLSWVSWSRTNTSMKQCHKYPTENTAWAELWMLFVALTASHSHTLTVKTRSTRWREGAGAASEETKQPSDETWTLSWVKSLWALMTDTRRNIYRDRPANQTSCWDSVELLCHWTGSTLAYRWASWKKVRISQMKRSLLKYKHWTDYFCFSGVEQKVSAPLTSPPPHSSSTTPPLWGKRGGTEIAKGAASGSSRFHGDVWIYQLILIYTVISTPWQHVAPLSHHGGRSTACDHIPSSGLSRDSTWKPRSSRNDSI